MVRNQPNRSTIAGQEHNKTTMDSPGLVYVFGNILIFFSKRKMSTTSTPPPPPETNIYATQAKALPTLPVIFGFSSPNDPPADDPSGRWDPNSRAVLLLDPSINRLRGRAVPKDMDSYVKTFKGAFSTVFFMPDLINGSMFASSVLFSNGWSAPFFIYAGGSPSNQLVLTIDDALSGGSVSAKPLGTDTRTAQRQLFVAKPYDNTRPSMFFIGACGTSLLPTKALALQQNIAAFSSPTMFLSFSGNNMEEASVSSASSNPLNVYDMRASVCASDVPCALSGYSCTVSASSSSNTMGTCSLYNIYYCFCAEQNESNNGAHTPPPWVSPNGVALAT